MTSLSDKINKEIFVTHAIVEENILTKDIRDAIKELKRQFEIRSYESKADELLEELLLNILGEKLI